MTTCTCGFEFQGNGKYRNYHLALKKGGMGIKDQDWLMICPKCNALYEREEAR